MTLLNTILAQSAGQGGGYSGILMIVAMLAIFYFFMIRPQSKKQKELKKAREAMRSGDKVVTAGGIHGRIRSIGEATMTIEISKGVEIKVDKASVYPVVTTTAQQAPKAKEKEEKPSEKDASAE